MFSVFLASDPCFLPPSHLKSTLQGIAMLFFLKQWSDHVTPLLKDHQWLSAA